MGRFSVGDYVRLKDGGEYSWLVFNNDCINFLKDKMMRVTEICENGTDYHLKLDDGTTVYLNDGDIEML